MLRSIGSLLLAWSWCFLSALRYFLQTTRPIDGERTGLLVEGIVLFVAATVLIVISAYYRGSRFAAVDQTQAESEAAAYALLGVDRLQKISLKLMVSPVDQRTLIRTTRLTLSPDRFTVPIRTGDTVAVSSVTNGIQKSIHATIEQIDGYNQHLTLRRVSSVR